MLARLFITAAKALIKILDKTDPRPKYRGVYLRSTGTDLSMVATNGSLLLEITIPEQDHKPAYTAMVPLPGMQALIAAAQYRDHIRFETNDPTFGPKWIGLYPAHPGQIPIIAARLADSDPPNYDKPFSQAPTNESWSGSTVDLLALEQTVYPMGAGLKPILTPCYTIGGVVLPAKQVQQACAMGGHVTVSAVPNRPVQFTRHAGSTPSWRALIMPAVKNTGPIMIDPLTPPA